jgi:hypothetical protein
MRNSVDGAQISNDRNVYISYWNNEPMRSVRCYAYVYVFYQHRNTQCKLLLSRETNLQYST